MALELKRRGRRIWRTLRNFSPGQWLTLAAIAGAGFALYLLTR